MDPFPQEGQVLIDPREVYRWLRAQPSMRATEANNTSVVDLDPMDWGRASQYIAAYQIVPATDIRPAIFWFEGRQFWPSSHR